MLESLSVRGRVLHTESGAGFGDVRVTAVHRLPGAATFVEPTSTDESGRFAFDVTFDPPMACQPNLLGLAITPVEGFQWTGNAEPLECSEAVQSQDVLLSPQP